MEQRRDPKKRDRNPENYILTLLVVGMSSVRSRLIEMNAHENMNDKREWNEYRMHKLIDCGYETPHREEDEPYTEYTAPGYGENDSQSCGDSISPSDGFPTGNSCINHR